MNKLFAIGLIALLAISSVSCVSAKTYYYPCHLDIGTWYGISQGGVDPSLGYNPETKLIEAYKEGRINYWCGVFHSEWDDLCRVLEKQGLVEVRREYTGNEWASLMETLNMKPIKECNRTIAVDMGAGYDPDYFDVVFS